MNRYLPHATCQANVEANSAKQHDGDQSYKRCYEELPLCHRLTSLTGIDRRLLSVQARHVPFSYCQVTEIEVIFS